MYCHRQPANYGEVDANFIHIMTGAPEQSKRRFRFTKHRLICVYFAYTIRRETP